MDDYLHRVQYYETDRMGITHHSNYIRWMEEARVDFLRNSGWGYDRLEAEGVICPVTAVSCRYKASTTFSDLISVNVTVAEFRGPLLKLDYVMKNEAGETVFEGRSEHCFLDAEGKMARLSKVCPGMAEVFENELKKKNADV